METNHKLLSRTAGPYNLRSVVESTANIIKDGVAISVSLDRVTKVPRVTNSTESIQILHNISSQLEPGKQVSIDGKTSV